MEIREKCIEALNQLKLQDNIRSLPEAVPDSFVDLSSNDYLGLNKDENIRNEFIDSFLQKKLKFSSTSSRLLSGNSPEYKLLEDVIADSYKREACLVFNSGYHANMGILPALAGKNDLIVADKFVHASIIDGMLLGKADVQRFRHLDYNHLDNILQTSAKKYENIFIVSESIFSMDGDRADLHHLIEIKNKYKALLYIDEAHAVGVRGENGLGCVEEMGCIGDCDFIVGTFGKALASVGAYVLCDDIYRQYLINNCRTLIYTTALPPINLAWTKFIFERLAEFKDKRNHLKNLVGQFSKSINVDAETQIIPFILGSNKNAIDASLKLKENGFNALPIRYPTVPKGTARLRFSLCAGMSMEQLKPIPKILLENDSNLDK